jgi:hypothetical protein
MGPIAVTLDLTITIGNVLTIGATIGAVFIAYAKLRERLVAIETKLEPMWREFERRRGRP